MHTKEAVMNTWKTPNKDWISADIGTKVRELIHNFKGRKRGDVMPMCGLPKSLAWLELVRGKVATSSSTKFTGVQQAGGEGHRWVPGGPGVPLPH